MKTVQFLYRGEERREPYHYTESGLDDIYLCGGYEQAGEGEYAGISIKHEDELLTAISVFLVTEKKVLSGKELRFLRKEMDLTQTELGRLVGLSSQQVARWENDKYEIPSSADYLLRVLYLQHIGKPGNVRKLLEELERTDADASTKHEFVRTSDGWTLKTAA